MSQARFRWSLEPFSSELGWQLAQHHVDIWGLLYAAGSNPDCVEKEACLPYSLTTSWEAVLWAESGSGMLGFAVAVQHFHPRL